MADRDLETIAREWWAGDGTQDAFNEVSNIGWNQHDRVPALIRAMLDTAKEAPPGTSIAYIGTSLIESLLTEPYPIPPAQVFALIRAAEVTHEELLGVLRGVYPEMLVTYDMSGLLGDVLTQEEIAWLTDRSAPGRRDFL
jgi:hypothetical protein